MEERNIGKFIHSLFRREPKNSPSINEYAFNTEDLKVLKKDNLEKLKNLNKPEIEILKKEEEQVEPEISNQEEPNETKETNYTNLEKEHQDLIMSKWKEIDITEIDKDIIAGKDLLNHNYTITYADEGAKYINNIREKYEIVICYLIGFNNEKKGITDKTTFANTKEDEWKYLHNYIKLLEKIRNFKMKDIT